MGRQRNHSGEHVPPRVNGVEVSPSSEFLYGSGVPFLLEGSFTVPSFYTLQGLASIEPEDDRHVTTRIRWSMLLR
jgi:hypothetical protein